GHPRIPLRFPRIQTFARCLRLETAMALAAASASASASGTGTNHTEGEVTITRLYMLRATYLLLIVGLGTLIGPSLINPAPMARGVIASLLGGVGLLALIGL